MPWATAAAIGGGSLISGYLGYKANKEAAQAQKKASKRAIREQRRQFNLLRQDQAPYREAGEFALGEMRNMLQGDYDLEETPGYQFRLEEGQQALTNNLAATGNRISGRAMKEAMRFGQGMASQEFGQQYNRLAGLAGTGQTAAQATGQAGMQTAAGISNALGRMGTAQARSARGSAASINRAIQGGIGNYLSYQQNQQMLNRLDGGPGYSHMYGNTYGTPVMSRGG